MAPRIDPDQLQKGDILLYRASDRLGNWISPMICSEFVYRTHDEALPDKVDPYSIDIVPLNPGAAPKRLLGRRRWTEKAAAIGHFHAESLLGQLQAQAGDVRKAICGTKPPSVQPAEPSDADLHAMIAAYVGEKAAAGPESLSAAGPAPHLSDLQDAVASLASALHAATDSGRELRPAAPDAPAAATPADTFLEFSADFVTPGDLWRSPSIVTVGELRP